MIASIYLSSLEPFNKSEIIHTCEEIVDTWCKLSDSIQDVGTHPVFEMRCNKHGYINVVSELRDLFYEHCEKLKETVDSFSEEIQEKAIDQIIDGAIVLKELMDFSHLYVPEIGLIDIKHDPGMDKEKEEYDVIIDFKEFKEIK